MKINDVFKSIISEEKSSKDRKIFYNIDINIAGDENKRFRAKGEGIVSVPVSDAARLITAEDVVVYLIQEEASGVVKDHGGFSGKDLLKEILTSFMDEEVRVEDYATRTDKILFSFDYGNDRNDSAGVLVNKIENSSSFSVVMRYNGNVQNAKFNRNTVDKQIQFFSREEY